MRRMDALSLRCPFYGSRQMAFHLRPAGTFCREGVEMVGSYRVICSILCRELCLFLVGVPVLGPGCSRFVF